MDAFDRQTGSVAYRIHRGGLDHDLRKRFDKGLQRDDHVAEVFAMAVLLPEHIRIADLLQRMGAILGHASGTGAPELGHAGSATQNVADIHA